MLASLNLRAWASPGRNPVEVHPRGQRAPLVDAPASLTFVSHVWVNNERSSEAFEKSIPLPAAPRKSGPASWPTSLAPTKLAPLRHAAGNVSPFRYAPTNLAPRRSARQKDTPSKRPPRKSAPQIGAVERHRPTSPALVGRQVFRHQRAAQVGAFELHLRLREVDVRRRTPRRGAPRESKGDEPRFHQELDDIPFCLPSRRRSAASVSVRASVAVSGRRLYGPRTPYRVIKSDICWMYVRSVSSRALIDEHALALGAALLLPPVALGLRGVERERGEREDQGHDSNPSNPTESSPDGAVSWGCHRLGRPAARSTASLVGRRSR